MVSKFTIILGLAIGAALLVSGLGSKAVENSRKIFDEAKKFRTKENGS